VKTRNRRIWTAVVIAVLVAAGVYLELTYGPWKPLAKSPLPQEQAGPVGVQVPAKGPLAATEERAPSATPAAPKVAAAAASAPSASASATLQQGLELMKAGKTIEARRALSAAIFSGTLSEAEADEARAAATRLAEETLFSEKFFDGDPYTFQYTFVSGDTINTVERKLKLHVPAQLILKINGLAHSTAIRAGQTAKMIQGPFHAVVGKNRFTLDLYLQRDAMEKVFVKRVKVGLGANGATPVGAWKVGVGKKMINATWYPPPSSTIHQPLRPGDPNYPLGKSGYWIGLVGTDANTAACDGYGLHGTNDPASIGKAASLGCIRLADPDIELVYSLLYEEWSTVQVVP